MADGKEILTFDGWRHMDVIAHLMRIAFEPSAFVEAEHKAETEAQDTREYGFCQVCGYTLLNCQCDEGPY